MRWGVILTERGARNCEPMCFVSAKIPTLVEIHPPPARLRACALVLPTPPQGGSGWTLYDGKVEQRNFSIEKVEFRRGRPLCLPTIRERSCISFLRRFSNGGAVPRRGGPCGLRLFLGGSGRRLQFSPLHATRDGTSGNTTNCLIKICRSIFRFWTKKSDWARALDPKTRRLATHPNAV